MKITDNVIIDLLPIYFEGEASEDTKRFVESYFQEHPDFAKKYETLSTEEFNQDIPLILNPEDELLILRKTKKLLKLKSFLFVMAVFTSLVPFTFGDVSWSDIEGVHWLWTDYPEGAVYVGLVALVFWLSYYMLNKRLNSAFNPQD